MAGLDPVIHQPARLQIMAALAALREGDSVEFTFLRELLGLTDGNLGAHLRRLEEEGYLTVEKTFVDRKPRTFVSLSVQGRTAFKRHVSALQAILGRKKR
jgi:DNA-binding MarR family transcriptional regulator